MVFGFFIARDITQRPLLSGDSQTNLEKSVGYVVSPPKAQPCN